VIVAFAVGTLPHAIDRILRCMPLIKALRETAAACTCGLMLLTTPASAAVPDAPAPVAVIGI
jgi:hypothetical protein